ncbi:LexA family transcriptional regulator [uncultured Dialister sp.]|jgi:repressor LexA|uniref:LexA family protein n=1 Tax=uncultured Dialister sp. TaxID=278064 RepID=UPI00206CF205|nr:S24 family peptidase [uncultured Dialister sp.]DAG50317.1 MAG TPA: Repressor protein CI [Caudoviricetes sp.]
MMALGENIKRARMKAQISQDELAKRLGYKSRSTIAKIESGENDLTQKKVAAFAKALNVSIDFLMDGDSNENNSKGVRIPVLGRVVAGIPLEAIEDIEDYEEIPRRMASSGEFFALRIKGRSMEPKLSEGDIVIVRKQEDVDSGDTAIVLVNGDEATVKQIKKTEAGIMLIGFNVEVYQPHFYSNDQIENLPVRIIGKVVESRHKW